MINMAFKVKYTEQAVEDIDEIIEYLSDELFSPQSAENFFKAMKEKLGLIRGHPYIFPFYHDDKLRSEGYRFAVIGNYLNVLSFR